MFGRVLLLLCLASPAFAQDAPKSGASPSLTEKIQTIKRARAYTTDRACPVKLPEDNAPADGWSLQEKWAWERICLGKRAWLDRADLSDPADLTRVLPDDRTDGHDCLHPHRPVDDAGVRSGEILPHRHLSTHFLSLILTRKPWSEAPITEGVWIECALFTEEIDLGKQNIVPEIVLRNTRLEKLISVFASRFEHSVNLQKSVLEAILYADHVEIDGGLYLDKGGHYAKIRLVGAQIEGGVYGNRSIFTKAFDADNMHVGEGLYMRLADLNSVDLPSSRIKGQFQLAGSRIKHEVDLSGSVIDQITLFDPTDQGDEVKKDPIWGEEARIVLRNVKTQALQARLDSWKRFDATSGDRSGEWIEADLTGFRYERLGGYLAERADTMLDHDGQALAGWINNVRPDYARSRYEPGPFEQLELALRSEGMASKADLVAYEKFERRSDAPARYGTNVWGWLVGEPGSAEWWQRTVHWPLSKMLVGYGVYPSRSAYAFVVIILVGTALGFASSSLRRLTPLRKFWYAVDNAVPIVTLDDDHKDFEHGPVVTTLYHVLKLLGFVLASYLIGALALPGI